MSSTMRITGFTTGWDTDQMVEDMMKAETMKLDKVKQDLQYVEWQQEAYRDIISDIKSFQSTYFDVLSPSTNIASTTSFAKYNYDITSNGVSTSAVTISAGGSASTDPIVINEISQLATKDTWSGNTSGMAGIKSSGFDIATLKSDLAGGDFEMTLAIGTDSEVITITNAELSSVTTDEGFASLLNDKISEAFGTGYSSVASIQDGELNLSLAGSTLKVYTYADNTTSLDSLGITSGASSADYTSKTLADLFGFSDADLAGFEINGVSIDLSSTDTYKEAMSKINLSNAGVTLSYDSLSDKFVLKSNKEGTVNNIDLEAGTSAATFFSGLFNVTDLSDPTLTHNEGQNAILTINDVEVVKSSNNFAIDGVAYTLNSTSTEPINIGIDVDTDAIVDNITNFVNDYNDLISTLTSKLGETRDYDYDPLTDAQKEEMSDEEIEQWEEKAKAGILGNSSELSAMLYKLRNVMIDSVEGTGGLSMSAIGISTTSYLDEGKLTIDEDKLRSALENNFDNVVKMFTQESDTEYLAGDSSVRYQENGVGSRLEDIIKDYARTTRNSNGAKGILLEKAGTINDITEYNNELSDKIKDYESKIDDLQDYLDDKEESYYLMFSNMETALSQMQAQYSSLLSMFGGSTTTE